MLDIQTSGNEEGLQCVCVYVCLISYVSVCPKRLKLAGL